MTIDEKITALCLRGLIQDQPAAERRKCLDAIRRAYGGRVADRVRRMLMAG